MTKKVVGIIRGGEGEGYEASLRRGGDLISYIHQHLSDKWQVVDIFIDKNGVWHFKGIEVDPYTLQHKVDFIWNTSHHSLAHILNGISVPYINPSAFSVLLESNHDVLKEHIKELKLKMPRKLVLPLYQYDFDGEVGEYVRRKAREIVGKFSAPWIVKTFLNKQESSPYNSMGVHLAKTVPELIRALEDGVAHKHSVVIEEFIYNKKVSAHSMKGFRRDDVYVFPLYGLSIIEKEKINKTVKDLHLHLGADHYLKSEFVLHPKRGVFLTDISLSLDPKSDSSLHQACEQVGAKVHHVVEHILEQIIDS